MKTRPAPDPRRLEDRTAAVLGLSRKPIRYCPCCGRPSGTVIPDYNPWIYTGTDEEWHEAHQRRRPSRPLRKGMDEPFCCPAAPCYWCIEWAKRELA